MSVIYVKMRNFTFPWLSHGDSTLRIQPQMQGCLPIVRSVAKISMTNWYVQFLMSGQSNRLNERFITFVTSKRSLGRIDVSQFVRFYVGLLGEFSAANVTCKWFFPFKENWLISWTDFFIWLTHPYACVDAGQNLIFDQMTFHIHLRRIWKAFGQCVLACDIGSDMVAKIVHRKHHIRNGLIRAWFECDIGVTYRTEISYHPICKRRGFRLEENSGHNLRLQFKFNQLHSYSYQCEYVGAVWRDLSAKISCRICRIQTVFHLQMCKRLWKVCFGTLIYSRIILTSVQMRCLLRLVFRVNFFPHISQSNDSAVPACSAICTPKFIFRPKDWPHSQHLYLTWIPFSCSSIDSSLCICWWRVRVYLCSKAISHLSQRYGFSSVVGENLHFECNNKIASFTVKWIHIWTCETFVRCCYRETSLWNFGTY